MNNYLRPCWKKYLKFDWKFGLLLLLLICVPRFILVLECNQSGNYSAIGIIMLISALLPFVFLNTSGRKAIGIKPTRKWTSLVLAVITGFILAYILYFIGDLMYENSFQNWFKYIGKSYNIPDNLSADNKRLLFFVTAGIGAVFSPIGEEFYFRGLIHGSFAKSLGEVKASVIDSTAFALTHLAHFGIVFINGQWEFYSLPALIWVLAMFSASILFFKMKKITDSIFGAVLCHASFNIGMTYCIFYFLN